MDTVYRNPLAEHIDFALILKLFDPFLFSAADCVKTEFKHIVSRRRVSAHIHSGRVLVL